MFSYTQMQKIVKHSVRGGDGEIHCRDYINSSMNSMPFEAFGLNEMQPGATIPEHCHADSEEFYFIVSGRGTGLHNGRQFEVGPATAGSAPAKHGILNSLVQGRY